MKAEEQVRGSAKLYWMVLPAWVRANDYLLWGAYSHPLGYAVEDSIGLS